ncbi:AraC family transcriptional regulator [Mesorhizobium sp. AD1-1]|uniref:AraC family transcriptional regulator n=1 Tax=Mesorhizobium sp. AD1-1 TaxID=2876621 RepID=UPI001CCF7A2C|nr:AraC family transcriptional regulator [Mesorhizobium sp. AD1-1]MBZ9719664.1 AraC family transcriptional regulator [Mesorhizobium sp. AD1-1]
MSTTHLIRSYLILPFVEAVEARGIDATAMLSAHGLEKSNLVEPHFRLPFLTFLAIQQQAADLVGDPCLGLRIGAEIRSEQVGSLGLLMATSRTLHEALTHFSHWGNAIGEGWALELIDTPQGSDYVYRVHELGVSTRQDVEYSLANLCSLIRTRMGRAWAPVEVHLGHSNPSRARLYEGVFGAPVFFGQPVNKLVIAGQDLALRSERVSYALLPIVEAHLRLADQVAAPDESLERRVGLIVAQSMGGRPAQINDVADKLGMPVRSLQRALAERQTSFRDIVRQERQRVAENLLAQGRINSITEIAISAGYADGSVFSRAYRTWTGSAPSRSPLRKGPA